VVESIGQSQLLPISLVLGALSSAGGMMTRGHSFLMSFIVISGFIFGVGTLVTRALDRFRAEG
jgi:hypothetical protein